MMDMTGIDSVATSLDQLLQLRHLPIPSARNAVQANSPVSGSFISGKPGQGSEYNDIRSYSSGDDIRHIDWQASARTASLQTRLYVEEKEHRINVICDLRECMFTGSDSLRASRVVLLSAKILWCASHSGSRISPVLLHSDGISTVAPGVGHDAAIRGCTLLSAEYERIALALSDKHKKTNSADSNRASTGEKLAVDDKENTSQKTNEKTNENASAHRCIRRQALPRMATKTEPTLHALLEQLTAQREKNSTHLWVSGLDFEGEQFTQSLASAAYSTRSVVIHIDDPMLWQSPPAGVYHYHRHSTPDRAPHSAAITPANARALSNHLALIRQERLQRYQTARINLLSSATGDEAVIGTLRHHGYLA